MTSTGLYPLPIIFASILMVALLGISSGYGQDNAPISPDPPTDSNTPGGRPSVREDTPSQLSDQLGEQRPTASPNLLMQTLLGDRDASRLLILLSLEEEYSDNFDQENDNPQRESRTTLTLGTRYQVQGKGRHLTLANTLDANYEASDQTLNIGFANFALDMGYEFPNLALSLQDTFVRDDSLEEASSTGTSRERTRFWRNSITPRVLYKLNRLATFELAYTNTLIGVEEGTQDDSVTDQIQVTLQNQFTRVLRGSLSATVTRDDDASSDPSYEFTMEANATYTLTRDLSLSATTSWSYTNLESEDTDSLRYGGDITARYQLAPDLSLLIGAGVSWFDDEEGDPELVFIGQLGLDGVLKIVPGTRLRLTSRQFVENTQGEVEDVGIVLRRTFEARLEQDISRTLLLELFANMTFTDSLENQSSNESNDNLKEFFWSTEAKLSYQLTRTLSLSLRYQHRRRDANNVDDEFVENRVLISITTGFSAL